MFVSSHHLAEVAQTVDRVVIINRGRLVAEAPLSELTARLAGTVRVQAARPDALEAALRNAGVTGLSARTERCASTARPPTGSERSRWPRTSRCGQLVTESSSLEDVFLELTAEPRVMIEQLRSELLKLRTTRTMAVLLLAAAALTLLGACVEGLSRTLHELAQEHAQRTMFSAAGSSVVLFATLAGLSRSRASSATGRSGRRCSSSRAVASCSPRSSSRLRSPACCSRSSAWPSFGSGLAILAARDVNVVLTSSHTVTLVFGPIAASAVGAMLGVAIGTLIRNQVGAIVAVVAYAFSSTPCSSQPSRRSAGSCRARRATRWPGYPVEHLLTPGAGAAVLVAWTLAFVAMATMRDDRSDI